MWLRDLLPRDIPAARILTFGYNANIIGAGSGLISDFATVFLSGLTQQREMVSICKFSYFVGFLLGARTQPEVSSSSDTPWAE